MLFITPRAFFKPSPPVSPLRRPSRPPVAPPFEEEGVDVVVVWLRNSLGFPIAGGVCLPTSSSAWSRGLVSAVTSGPTGAATTVAARRESRVVMVNCIFVAGFGFGIWVY